MREYHSGGDVQVVGCYILVNPNIQGPDQRSFLANGVIKVNVDKSFLTSRRRGRGILEVFLEIKVSTLLQFENGGGTIDNSSRVDDSSGGLTDCASIEVSGFFFSSQMRVMLKTNMYIQPQTQTT